MSRYVDISKLEIPEDDCCYADLESFVETICESEYIDICFCGECKYWNEGKCWNLKGLNKTDGAVNADDFCSYGEREGE